MRKFYGKDYQTCIYNMGKCLDLHQVSSVQKVNIVFMFLEQDQHVWYQCLCERK